ncbi:hypothetical protein MKW94_005285 [Papaver nudicaule]|uniref:Hexosyltransferase n=1 Tax=Papaver nudicaule TaxID=74823 RepID=A0AA41V9F8_PAPNU|nr:hypothetical protein [Papaver nudicaule]
MAPQIIPRTVDNGGLISSKQASSQSRSYVTFLAGDKDYVKGVIGLAKGLRKVKTAYPLVVTVLPDVPQEHRNLLEQQGCIVREIEPVYPPENQTQFAMAYYVINYSYKNRKMIYLDGDIQVFENIDHLFDLPNCYFYAVMDCFCEKEWSQTPQYKIGYCQQCPDRVKWPAEMGAPPSLYFNAGMFFFEPNLFTYHDLLKQDTYKPILPVYNLVLAMLWRHPENVELDKAKVQASNKCRRKPFLEKKKNLFIFVFYSENIFKKIVLQKKKN